MNPDFISSDSFGYIFSKSPSMVSINARKSLYPALQFFRSLLSSIIQYLCTSELRKSKNGLNDVESFCEIISVSDAFFIVSMYPLAGIPKCFARMCWSVRDIASDGLCCTKPLKRQNFP